jgi:putative PEP-CTERM system TPR-repeat lipoprotein
MLVTESKTMRRMKLTPALFFASSLVFAHQAQADARDPALAKKYGAQADQSLAKDDYDGAEVALKNARKADPQDSAIRIALANVELHLNDIDGALADLKAARDGGGDDSKIIPLIGQAYLIQGKYDALLNDFPVSDSGPLAVRTQTLMMRAAALAKLGRTEEARNSLLDAEKLEPQSSAPKFALARLDFTHNQTDSALAETDEILRVDPSADAHFLRGEILAGKGDNAGALYEFNEAIKANPHQLGALIERAQVFLRQGEDAKAEADIKSALALNPKSVAANYFQASLLYRAKDFTGADTILTKFAGAFPDFAEGYYLTAEVKLALNEYEQAETSIDAYVAAQSRNPGGTNDVKGLKFKADILMRKGAFEGAAEVLEKAATRNSSDAEIFTMLGRAYMQSDVRSSIEAFQRAIQIAPDNIVATRGLALDYLAENQSEQSVAGLERVIQLAPNDAQSAESVAIVDIEQKQYAKAAQIIADLTKKRPDDPIPPYLSGLLLRDQLRGPEAKTAFLAMEQKFPDFLPVKLQLAKLDADSGDEDAASAEYQAVLAKDPSNLRALEDLSAMLMARRKPMDVLELWKKAGSAQPDNISVDIGLIHAYIANGDLDGGLGAMREMQLRQPKQAKLYELRAELETRKKDFPAAVISVKAVTELLPDSAIAMRDLALSEEKAGDMEAAMTAIAQARKLDPTDLSIATDEVRLIGLKDPDAGVAAARRFADLLPDFGAAQTMEGDYLLSLKRPADAEAAYRKAFQARPSLALAERLAQSALRDGKSAEGEKILTDWSAARPNDIPARFSLASFLQAENKIQAARAEYEKILTELPDSAVVLNNLALIYAHEGDQRALDYARRALIAGPGNPKITDTLGWIMAQKNDAAGSVKLLRQAHDLAPADLEIEYHLAYALNRAGDKTDAADLLKSALSTGRDFDGKSDAQALLGQLSKG